LASQNVCSGPARVAASRGLTTIATSMPETLMDA
jgi:hypothetical protein